MIEILLIVLMGQRVRKVATAKGLPGGWAAIVLLIPVAGIATMMVALTAVLATGVADSDLAPLFALPFYLAAELGTAFLIDRYMKNKPAAAVPAAAAAPVVGSSYTQAGMCTECGRNVYLAQDGSCQFGHPASSIRDVYFTPRPDPSVPAGA